MSVPANQARTFLRLIRQLQPYWRRDAALPARIQSLLASHRQFGARDRRLYRELIYTTLRHLPWIEPVLESDPHEAVRRVAWLAADLPATKLFKAALATGTTPDGDRSELLPGWFRPHCPEVFSGAELDAQLRRALLWLRLQCSETDEVLVFREFEARGWNWRRSVMLPSAVELLTETDVTRSDAWRNGRIEIQDLGSQMILASIGVEPGGSWLDACAGAGGKTLQLARLLGSDGRIDAFDVRPEALEELGRRAARAGIPCVRASGREAGELRGGHGFAAIRILETPPAGEYEGVLVDAPCSGSGTWRRAPHLKWTTTGSDIEQAAARQRGLLARFAARVRPGGRLIYATCSLSRRENEDVVAAFLSEHPEFQPAPLADTFGFSVRGAGITLLPARYDTDGFFVASLRRR